MSVRSIYDSFIAAGLSHEGACGLMGNLKAESSMLANIAQRGMTSLSDAAYTAKFNSDPDSCLRDSVGYGLAQWTFWSRKQALWSFCKARGKSVGDESAQTEFIIHELKEDYPGLFAFLCETSDLYSAADRVCREYERPAVNNVDRRYEFAQDFDESFTADETGEWFPPDLSILVLQAVLVGNGYNTEISGYKDAQFYNKLREFVKDIGG